MMPLPATQRNELIEPGHKFALLALPIRNLAASLGATRLTGGLELIRQSPLAMPEQWRRWIGELGEKAVSGTAAYLLLSRPSVRPDVLDGENQALMQAVCYFWDSLLMVETPCCGEPQLLSGANVNGEIKVRSLRKLCTPVRHAYSQATRLRQLAPPDFAQASTVYKKLHTLAGSSAHQRFQRALSAFFEGIHESRHDRRLHQFCRCIDGIICSRKGKGLADFQNRTALFIGVGHENVTGEIYQMRGAVEHLRPATTEAVGCNDEVSKRRRVIERAVQAEIIARHCVIRIMSSDNLLDRYKTDDEIDTLWSLAQPEQKTVWGDALDFNADVSGAFDPALVDDRDLH